MRFLFASSILVASLAAACSAAESSDDTTAEAQLAPLGSEGSACENDQACVPGLLCKGPSSGPPPGAVGLPLPSDGVKPQGLPGWGPAKTCQKPAPGEQGASCIDDSDCNPDLVCELKGATSGGPPPGAVGLPLPSGAHTQGRPVLGLPIPPEGKCRPSGGPPPGAVGLPIPTNG